MAWIKICQPRLSIMATMRFELLGRQVRRAGWLAVLVRRQHRRRPALDHAVGEDLDDAGLQRRVVAHALPVSSMRSSVGLGRAGRGRQGQVGAHLQSRRARSASSIERHFLEAAAGVLHAGDAELVRVRHGRAQCAARRSRVVGFGMTLSTRPAADSFKCPVGSPVFGSLTTCRWSGLGVSLVMPASASAFEFTQTLWPS